MAASSTIKTSCARAICSIAASLDPPLGLRYGFPFLVPTLMPYSWWSVSPHAFAAAEPLDATTLMAPAAATLESPHRSRRSKQACFTVNVLPDPASPVTKQRIVLPSSSVVR